VPKAASTASPYSRAVARLARRDHSEQEIRRALRRDGFPDEAVESTVQRLRREGALDDAGFAARVARSRLAHSSLGRNRIRLELRRKGVAASTTEGGLHDALKDVSEAEVADRLARRYWRSRERDLPPQRLRKLWAFLVRRGFPPDLVHARLRALWPRWADALEGLEPVED
jgi:regulatory protein